MLTEFAGKRAVVTGGASGMGRGLVRALLDLDATVLALDFDGAGLDAETQRAESLGKGSLLSTFVLDVSDPAQMDAAKAHADNVLGGVDLLILNAGVAFNSLPLWETPHQMVKWTFDVNVYGVTNGIRSFVPDMIAAGTGGHIVNTASIGGFQVRESPMWYQGLYAASKFAVVALSEALSQDLAKHNIGVSILAPAAVNTGIADSERVLPRRFTRPDTEAASDQMRAMLAGGLSPDFVAQVVLKAVRDDTLYIFTHPEDRGLIERRHEAISAGLDVGERVLAQMKD